MWIKKIKYRRFQMMIMVIIVLLSSLLLSSAITILMSSDKPMKKLIVKTHAPQVYIVVSALEGLKEDTDKVMDMVQGIEHVSEVKCIPDVVTLNGNLFFDGEKITTTTKYFMAYQEGQFAKLNFLSDYKELKKDECYIGTATAHNYGIEVGDLITVNCPDYVTKLRVAGIYSEPYSMSASLGNAIFYVTDEQLELIEGMRSNMVTVYGDSKADDEEILDAYHQVEDDTIKTSIHSLSEAKMISELSQKILGGFIIAFAVIILLVSSTVIRSCILDNMQKEFRTIGIYKAMGYSSSLIRNIYLKIYCSVLLAAALLGGLLSILVSKVMIGRNTALYGIDCEINYVMPLGIAFAVIASYSILLVYRAVRHTKDVKPVEALTMSEKVNNTKASLKGLEHNFSAFWQSVRKIIRNKKSSVILFFVLLISAYMVCFSITCYLNVCSLSTGASFWFGIDKSQYRVYLTDKSIAEDVVQYLDNKEEVEEIVTGTLLYLGTKVENGEASAVKDIALQSYDSYDNTLAGDIIRGRNPQKENEIALSQKIMKKMDKDIGDTVTLVIADNEVTYEIVGSFQSMFNNSKYGRVLEAGLLKVDESYQSANVCFTLKEAKSYKAIKKELLKTYPNKLDVDKSNEYLRDSLEPIEETQKMVLIPFCFMVMLIGAINVFSILTLLNVNSKKEFTIYRAIGYRAWDLIRTNETYVVLIGILASVICIPVFLVTYAKIMNTLFQMMGIYNYPTNYNIPLLMVSLAVMILVCVISTVLSSLSIRKIKVQNLNEE